MPERPRKQEQEPATDEVQEVGPNVVRLQLPIQMTGLGHVNMYALIDERGVAIVDPGMPGPTSWRWVPKRLSAAGFKVRDVHTVIITHSHPDHFGGAAQLASEAGADVVTHAAFRSWHEPHNHADAKDSTADGKDSTADGLPAEGGADHDHAGADDHAGHVHAADGDGAGAGTAPPGFKVQGPPGSPWGGPPPWAPGATEAYGKERRQMMRGVPLRRRVVYRVMGSRAAGGAMRRMMSFPTVTQRLNGGDVIKLAGREWTAVHTPGHTADHLCLYDPEAGLLLSGDHVLPTITPHISGLGPQEDALGAFFTSLDRVADLPDVRLVLPAHGHPFADVKGRVKEIKDHHEERLDKLRQVAAELGPQSVIEFSHHLFRQERWGSMAESETFAHLERLRLQGLAESHVEDGLLVYDLAPPGQTI